MDTSSATAQDHLLKVMDGEIKVSQPVSQELKYRRNALVPISRLPTETLVEIFSLLPSPAHNSEYVPYLEWICITHVCHRWREIALSFPYLWNHIHFTKLTLAGITEILARAKMSPLHIEADIFPWKEAQLDAFGRQLEAHISHTRHLTISGECHTLLGRLLSPAPALVSLSLTESYRLSVSPPCIIPGSLFSGTAPKLTRLELLGCSIGWKSPLLKGLQTLKMVTPTAREMPTLEDWLDALNEMFQLKSLILDNATPIISYDYPHIPDPQRTVTLPSLTHFDITASTWDCALALAHLVLPALISLHVTSESQSSGGDDDDIRILIPYVARNAHGPQDTAPLQSMLFNGEELHVEIVAWTAPDADVGVCNSVTLTKAAVSARLVWSITSDGWWGDGMETVVFDAMLSHLPLNAISTLSVQNKTRLSKEVWLNHAPRLTKLNRVLLVSTALRAFGEMLEEDAPPDGRPRLPRLTKLILSKVSLTLLRTWRLCDMLKKRKEHGAPLEAVDLRTCIGQELSFRLPSEIVGNVQCPTKTLKVRNSAFLGWSGGLEPFFLEEEVTDNDEYADSRDPWKDSMNEGGEGVELKFDFDDWGVDLESDSWIDQL